MKITILIFVFFAYAFYLLKKSKSNFFKQDRGTLFDKRKHLINVLEDFGVDLENDKRWLESYDNFKNYPNIFKYDGATIVKDNHTINGYDAPAGNHDMGYIFINDQKYLKWLKESTKLDCQYAKDMRKLKINWLTSYSRFVGLILIKPFYPIFRKK